MTDCLQFLSQTQEGSEVLTDGFADVAKAVLESFDRGEMPHVVEGVSSADSVFFNQHFVLCSTFIDQLCVAA